ncbi:YdiU family protein [Psychromonas sp. B3M02]|uniref:protein adenylyltransferase SelO n=1 Tax=Psychromonas sp. B3M02 TaxID=2267226 RepID=UPI000DEBF8C8|nr:YdiU family protein [Psychromonas sp. B3M02]RBW47234.1 YdiU family protein [Psychromonas sp. B3M02]
MSTVLPSAHPTFVSQLPADPDASNRCRTVEHAAYSWVTPCATKATQIICCNHNLAAQLGFNEQATQSQEFADLVSGNLHDPSIKPYAMNYGGHQFGQWAGQLGDGRAINLGQYQLLDSQQQVTLQLKGAGKTPYSRRGDGMAVLRSSIREYLCSEAMYHLGIPTTRALTLTLTGEQVIRDKLYDGHAAYEPCAIVARVSPSFLRFGSLQLPGSRGDLDTLKQTLDYCIKHDYASLIPESGIIDKAVYLAWFESLCERTAQLIVEWMRVGFVHGVLNTDNMSLIGETIDYGPYGWIDNFDLDWTPNTSDAGEKRYRFGQQAYIGQWNLFQLANTIYPLINEAEPLQAIFNNYNHLYNEKWLKMMREKLGIAQHTDLNESTLTESDKQLCTDLETVLSTINTDMTLFYRCLADYPTSACPQNSQQLQAHFAICFYNQQEVTEDYLQQLSKWLISYQQRLKLTDQDDQQRKIQMDAINPCYILRNFQVQEAIELAEHGDYSRVLTLAELLKTPYQQQDKYQQFEMKRPDWATNKFGCSALSCSS